MFVRVLPEELSHCPLLTFNLHNGDGKLKFSSGLAIEMPLIRFISQNPVYRLIEKLPETAVLNHEGSSIGYNPADLTTPLPFNPEEGLFSDGELKPLLQALKPFYEKLEQGCLPDISLCEIVGSQLIASVSRQVEHLQYISQLRVRDEVTYAHVLDVTALSIALAIQLGLSQKAIQEVALAAMLHDLGKLMVPYNIMFKEGKLTEKEFQIMQLHPGFGYGIITQFLQLPEQIARPALEHQEMYGGNGYPKGIVGEDIHPYSHIVKIADVYDALTSARPYKKAIPHEKALQIMLSEGTQSFHPEFLEAFSKIGQSSAAL